MNDLDVVFKSDAIVIVSFLGFFVWSAGHSFKLEGAISMVCARACCRAKINNQEFNKTLG
jgi:hypothetical protein